MNTPSHIRSRKILLSVLCAGCMAFASHAALAAVEGCDPNIMAAQQARAGALVAASVAVTDQMTPQPESTALMTCQDQAFGVSASKGGSFSGDFSLSDAAAVLDDAQLTMAANFGDTFSFNAQLTNAPPAKLSAAGGATSKFNCDKPGAIWAAQNAAGVQPGAPYPTEDVLLSGTPDPAAGTKYQTSMQSPNTQQLLQDYQKKHQAINNKPCIPVGQQDTVDEVLATYQNPTCP